MNSECYEPHIIKMAKLCSFLKNSVSSVSDETADVVDVVCVNMSLDLWGALGWVKQQGVDS
jgi:hypothetical protein